MRKLLFLAIQLMAALISDADDRSSDWPEFRGPGGQGHSGAAHVPLAWSPKENVAWRSVIPGKGWSSPVVEQGKIYLTSALEKGGGISLNALALDGAKGTILWNVEVFRADKEAAEQIHNKNSLASPTPVIRDDRIYVHFGHMGTAALSPNGKILWKQNGLAFRPVHGNGGSPALAGELLIFSCDGAEDPFLAALDAKSGAVRWKTRRETAARNKFSFSTPLAIEVQGETEIISATSGFVGGYSPQSGKELWRVRYGEGYSVVPRPVFGGGLLFVSSGFDRPVIYAIDPTGAAGDATESKVRWTQAKGAPNTPSPLLIGDWVYLISDGGIMSCLEASTGRIVWSERLGGGFSASPVAAEGRIYAINESGTTFVCTAGPTFKLLAKNDLNERALASPAVVEGGIIIRTESTLWRIGSTSLD